MMITIKKLWILPFILGASSVLAQSTHVIDEFKNVSDYYVGFNSGLGSATHSIDLANPYSGNSSLALNYSFSSGAGAFFSALKNYSTHTQDFSFRTENFTLAFRGGNASETIALRFWEDINGNGIFDGDDEVFTSQPTVLGSSSWTNHTFNINQFTKVTGSGNGQLDLNRVRGWDVVIHNSSNTSGTVWIDKLTLTTGYTVPNAGTAKLNGSFIQLWNTAGCNCGEWTQARWEEEMQKMKGFGLEKIVIQYGVFGDVSWYAPTSLSGIAYQMQTLNKIFAAAEAKNMKIVTGLYFDMHWDASDKTQSTHYQTLLQKHETVIDEIWTLFGSSSAFAGWYIPQELNDLEWQTEPAKSLLFNWLKDVTDYAKSKSSTHPTLIAPFINLWQPADLVADWYDELFTVATNLDAIYPQDGLGITLKNLEYHVPLYFTPLKEVCDNHDVSFNVTVESFEQLTGWPVDGGTFSATSAPIERLKHQLWVADDLGADEIIQFEWAYMQEGLTSAATALYEGYQAYTSSLVTSIFDFKNAEKTLAFWPNPANKMLYFEGEEVVIYDYFGSMLLTSQHSPVSVSTLAPGLYIVQIEGESGKLVVE